MFRCQPTVYFSVLSSFIQHMGIPASQQAADFREPFDHQEKENQPPPNVSPVSRLPDSHQENRETEQSARIQSGQKIKTLATKQQHRFQPY